MAGIEAFIKQCEHAVTVVHTEVLQDIEVGVEQEASGSGYIVQGDLSQRLAFVVAHITEHRLSFVLVDRGFDRTSECEC